MTTADHGPRWFHPALVGLVAVVLYLPTIRFGTVNYDDPWLLEQNVIVQTASLSNLRLITTDLMPETRRILGSEYLPVRDLSVMLDFALFGDNYHGHHLTNVLLYGLICSLVGIAFLCWFDSKFIAWVGALLFAVHPVHVETVAWLSERKGLLAAAFSLLACCLLWCAARRPTPVRFVLLALALVAAVWSKALAIAILPLLFILLWLRRDDLKPTKATRLSLLCVASLSIVALVPYFIAGRDAQMVSNFHGGSFWNTLGMMGEVHSLYLKQLFWGGPYAIRYPFDATHRQIAPMLIGLGAAFAILVLSGWLLFQKGRRIRLVVPGLWWLFFLAPVSQIIFPLQNIAADRYLFLPSLAGPLIIALLLARLKHRRLCAGIVIGLVLISASMTWFQTRTWATSETLHRHAVAVDPSNVDAMIQLAKHHLSQGETKAASDWLKRAGATRPMNRRVLLHQGLFAKQQGDNKNAIAAWLRAKNADPKADKVRSNLALLLNSLGHTANALAYAQAAVRINPLRGHNQRTLGVVLLKANRITEALEAFQSAVRVEPENKQNCHNMGLVLVALGRPDQAAAWFACAKDTPCSVAKQRQLLSNQH